jgi:two-component system response regulator HupR/HoxA
VQWKNLSLGPRFWVPTLSGLAAGVGVAVALHAAVGLAPWWAAAIETLPAIKGINVGVALREWARRRHTQRLLDLQSEEIIYSNNELEKKFGELETKIEQLSLLIELSAAVNATLDPEKIYDQALDRLVDRMGYEAAHLFLVDRERRVLRGHRTRGVDSEQTPTFEGMALPLDPDASALARVAVTGLPVLVTDVEAWRESVHMPSVCAFNVRSLESINAANIYHFVVKPWDPKELTHTVRRGVERYQLARERDLLLRDLAAKNQDPRHGRGAGHPLERGSAPDVWHRGGDQLGTRLGGHDRLRPPARAHRRRTARQGALRSSHPRQRPPPCCQVRRPELRGPARVAAGVGAVRARARGLHGGLAERRGLFEEADGGTIFLDEVGEMSPGMQLRMLRVLQEGEIRRVGASATRTVDVRVLAATNADLEADVDAGRFRKDLYYRLNVFPIHLPPLRDRVEDIPALANQFLKIHRQQARRAVPAVSPEALALLRSYPFPGNVRELENEIERAVTLAENGRPIGPEHLSERIRSGGEKLAAPVTLGAAIEQLKRRMIEDALRECGSKTRAPERLGLTRQSLQQMLRRRQP